MNKIVRLILVVRHRSRWSKYTVEVDSVVKVDHVVEVDPVVEADHVVKVADAVEVPKYRSTDLEVKK